MTNEDRPIDHIGLELWQAAQSWRRRLSLEMRRHGIDWYCEARANLIPLLDPGGTRLSELTKRSGVTRQAVHQWLADLEREGIVERAPDPSDRRGRIVRFTVRGRAVLGAAIVAKRDIEADYAARLGAGRLATLKAALAAVREADDLAATATPVD